MTDTTVQNGSTPVLDESILNTVKKLIGFEKEYGQFDMDLLIHINTSISTLTQLGVGPSEGFSITGETETWGALLGTDKRLDSAKTYIYIKCKLIFDPPPTSFVISALEKMAQEIEWRINVTADPYMPEEVVTHD